jgi:ABC-type nitrate/sulfonate/bicarbonate transport system permease component
VSRATTGRLVRRTATALALPLLLLAAWWFASAGSKNPYYPPLRTIIETFPPTWLEGGGDARIVADVLPSLARLMLGLALAAGLGVGGGLLIGRSPAVRAITEPVLEVFRAVPPPALVPLLVAVAGIDTLMKVLVIVLGCVWPVLLNTVEGVRSIDPVLSDTCRAYGVQGQARLRALVLRSASPQIMTGLRQALSLGVILMVISEMFAASNGIGYTVVQFQRTFSLPEMWTGIIVLGLLGVILARLFRLVEARVLSWYHGQRRTQRS